MSYMAKFVAALVGLVAMVIVASRQLFLFTVFKGSQGVLNPLGGTDHLWLAIGAGITGCIAGGLMFRFIWSHEKEKWSKARMAPGGPLLTADSVKLFDKSVTATSFKAISGGEPRPWLSEGQADDRRPVNGSVADSARTPSSQRAFARRSHQVTFKKWSQARHD